MKGHHISCEYLPVGRLICLTPADNPPDQRVVPFRSVAGSQFQAIQFAGNVRDINSLGPQIHDSMDHRRLFGVPNQLAVVELKTIRGRAADDESAVSRAVCLRNVGT